MKREIDIEIEGVNYTAYVLSYTPADPGKTYGNPEDCYPPTDAEVEFNLVDEEGMLCGDVAALYHDRIVDMIVERLEEPSDDEQ